MTGTIATMALPDFLLARIAEDEADPWRGAQLFGADRAVGKAEHQALADEERAWEARVLAECEAKRRIVATHADGGESQGYAPPDGGNYGYHPHACVTCGTFGEYAEPWPCPTLRALALPYADHPDYRDEWKP